MQSIISTSSTPYREEGSSSQARWLPAGLWKSPPQAPGLSWPPCSAPPPQTSQCRRERLHGPQSSAHLHPFSWVSQPEISANAEMKAVGRIVQWCTCYVSESSRYTSHHTPRQCNLSTSAGEQQIFPAFISDFNFSTCWLAGGREEAGVGARVRITLVDTSIS